MNRKKLMSIASAAVFTIMSASFAAMSAFAEEAADTASSTQQTTSQGSFFTLILPLIIMFALLYFIAIRPQKKRDKELKEMQDSLQVGDEVVTGGGIVGMVVSVGEDTVVIETGGAKHKLRIKNWAITENVTAMERAKAAKAENDGYRAGFGDYTDPIPTSGGPVHPEKKSKKKKKDEE